MFSMFEIFMILVSILLFIFSFYLFYVTNKNGQFSKNKGLVKSDNNINNNFSIPCAVCKFYVDNDFTSFEYNKQFLDLIGYTEKAFKEEISCDFSKIIFIADYDNFKYEMSQQITYSSKVNLSFKIVKRNGTFSWIMLTGALYKDENDRQYLLATFTDISDTKKVDESSKDLESKIKEKVYENLSSGILILSVDENPSILYINKVGIMFFGYSYYQIKEKFQSKILNFIYDDDIDLFKNIIAKVSQFDEDYVESFSCRIVSKVGRIYWVHCMARLSIDEHGNRYAFIVFVDTTKSKSLETRLRMENNELNYIYKNVNIGTCILSKDNNDFKIVSINKFAISNLDYTGFVENDFVGANVEKIIYIEDLQNIKDVFNSVLNNDSEISITFRCLTKTGDIKWMRSIVKIYKGDSLSHNILMTLIDVTDIKLYEDKLLKNEVRYISSIENANIHVIDWDVKSDTLKLSPKSASILGLGLNVKNAYKKLLSLPLVYEGDRNNIKNAVSEVLLGSDFAQCRIRIKENGNYVYYKIIFTSFIDYKKTTERAIGLLINDHSEGSSKDDILNSYEESKFYKDIILLAQVNFATDKFINGLDYVQSLCNNNLVDSYQKYMDKLISSNIIHKQDQEEFLNKFDRRNLMVNAIDEDQEFSMNIRLLQEDGSYKKVKYILSLDRNTMQMCPVAVICIVG